MHRHIPALALAMMVATGACSRTSNKSADSALNADLSRAAQQGRAQRLDTLSAVERGLAPTPAKGASTATESTTHAATAHRATSSGVHHSSGGGTVEKHTQRDAAIGAAAGAVIGAATSRNKVKGGLIGAAVGGVVGGVIGNNVDKTKKKP
jgi:hypothetical protein